MSCLYSSPEFDLNVSSFGLSALVPAFGINLGCQPSKRRGPDLRMLRRPRTDRHLRLGRRAHSHTNPAADFRLPMMLSPTACPFAAVSYGSTCQNGHRSLTCVFLACVFRRNIRLSLALRSTAARSDTHRAQQGPAFSNLFPERASTLRSCFPLRATLSRTFLSRGIHGTSEP